LALAAHQREIAAAHRFTDTMRHEPSGFQGHAKAAVKLVRADALLASGDEEDRLQPDVQRHMRTLEDGSLPHGELLAALVALVQPFAGRLAFHFGDALDTATMRASRAVRPNVPLYICERCVLVVVVRC
jgi:hypothetical protein